MRKRNMFKAALSSASVVAAISGSPVVAQELETVKVTFIQHCCSGATFFQPMQFGAEEAARLFNVELTYVNADGDAARAANLIETAIAEGQDAVIPTITVPDALDEAVQKAKDAGLIVIVQNIDDPMGSAGNARDSFVGQNFIASGAIIGCRRSSSRHEGWSRSGGGSSRPACAWTRPEAVTATAPATLARHTVWRTAIAVWRKAWAAGGV